MARKKKAKGVQYWKKRAWEKAFSPYIRLRDAIKTTGTKDRLICCSCHKEYPAFGMGCAQAGHFIPGRGNAVLYDEEQVNGQCFNCNIRLKGNWPNYYIFMLQFHTREELEEMIIGSKQAVHYTAQDHKEIYEKYKRKLEELKE